MPGGTRARWGEGYWLGLIQNHFGHFEKQAAAPERTVRVAVSVRICGSTGPATEESVSWSNNGFVPLGNGYISTEPDLKRTVIQALPGVPDACNVPEADYCVALFDSANKVISIPGSDISTRPHQRWERFERAAGSGRCSPNR